MVRAEPIFDIEDLAGAPLATDCLPLNGAECVGGEGRIVVLVGFRDSAALVNLEKVHGDPEVFGREIGKAVGGGFVGYGEGIAQILDRELALSLCRGQEFDRGFLRNHERGSKVVGLHSLVQKL